MGGLRVCKEKTAEKPYFIKKIAIHISSIEELCFYLQNNFSMVDEGILNEELFAWLEQELEMPRLAGVLRQNVAGGASCRKLTAVILEYCKYCSREQVRALMMQMQEKEKMPDAQMLKTIGDRMLENRRYEKAIREYRNILYSKYRDTLQPEFVAAVYHNMGVAYAQLFLYDEAAKCFATAYDKGKDPVSKELYEAAVQLGGKRVFGFFGLEQAGEETQKEMSEKLERLVQEATEDGMVKRFQKIRQWKKEGKLEEYQNALTEFLDEMKQDCIKNVGY